MKYLLLITLVIYVTGENIAPELLKNQLKFPWGVAFKYNGELNHNIDRVWIVTTVHIQR